MPRKKGPASLPLPVAEIVGDYRLAYRSRQASLIGRREVLSGKAKFGIFGDGKELANIAIARAPEGNVKTEQVRPLSQPAADRPYVPPPARPGRWLSP